MKIEDFRQAPCACPACQQAGVDQLEQVRDYHTGAWLHGYNLKRWYEAKAKFDQLADTIKPKGMA